MHGRGRGGLLWADRVRRRAQIEAALVTDDADSCLPPMFIDQLGYLSGMTTQGDQKPGQDAYARFQDLRLELDRLLVPLNQLTTRLVEASPD